MYQVGILFIYSNKLPFKPFSEKNKQQYKKKKLLHSFTTILESEDSNKGFKLYDTEQKISMKNVEQFLNTEFDFSKDEIIDYTPIRKSFIKNIDINKSLSLFSVILNHKHPTINLKTRQFVFNTMLPFYTLDTINPNTYDICEAINKYHKINNLEFSNIKCINNNELLINISVLFKSMYGLITLEDETKRYI